MSIKDLDPHIHPPKRLAVMAILDASASADFKFLKARLGVSDSDLSKQMRVLVEVGYVKATKSGMGPNSFASYTITRVGRRALARHITGLQALINVVGTPSGPSFVSPHR